MKKGISIIEVLIVVCIIGIISSIFIYSFRQQVQQKKLDGIANTIVAKLQESRNLSQSGKNGQTYGVKFNVDSFVTFIGTSYASTTQTNVAFPVDSAFQITNTIPGADDMIVFSKIYGEVDFNINTTTADIVVSEKNNPNNKITIVVGRLGDVSVIK
jgi:Tfp pilus assembly protein PilE